jgi:hypothetical protein
MQFPWVGLGRHSKMASANDPPGVPHTLQIMDLLSDLQTLTTP